MPSYLVTGSSRGLGLAFVGELLKSSQNYVIATARDPTKATQLQALIDKHPKDRAAILQLDLANPESIKKAATEAASLLPDGLDCLVGNAGVSEQPMATFEQSDLKLFADEMNLEIINNAILIRSFLPLIRKAKAGKLVFISSIIGSVELAAGMPGLNDAYAVSRAALNMLIRKWGAELKFEGIATAVVHPGWVPSTDLGSGIIEWMEKYAPSSPRVSIPASAAGVVKIFETLTIDNTNSFFNYDGTKLPW